MDVRLKRAYEPPATSDGHRVSIDRLWPPGVRREGARLDEWARELAPSCGAGSVTTPSASASFVVAIRPNWRGRRRSCGSCVVGTLTLV
jgi:hypothetical protein